MVAISTTKMASRTVRYFGLTAGLATALTYIAMRKRQESNLHLISTQTRESDQLQPQKLPSWRISDGEFDQLSSNLKYTKAIGAAEELTTQCMLKYGAPGCVVAVSVDGRMVWARGFGLSDVENNVPCSAQTVMRIASISKSLTSVAVAKLWEEGLLDLDRSIREYAPSFPTKTFEGKPAEVTTRQLLTHTGCIRHYKKSQEKEQKQEKVDGDARFPEFHSTKAYKSVSEALELFKDDELECKPGEKFLYTTHGWTLISAVIEGVSGKKYLNYMKESVFEPLGMRSVQPEYHADLISRRSKHYRMSKTLQNAPYVDNSLKWAGGGFVSNAVDLVKLGNALMSIYQYPKEDSDEHRPGLLKPSTVTKMWSPVIKSNLKNFHYGWGWLVSSPRSLIGTTPRPKVVMHTGGAVGATSILLIQPREMHSKQPSNMSNSTPQGVVVAVLFNLESVKEVDKLAISIAEHFSAE